MTPSFKTLLLALVFACISVASASAAETLHFRMAKQKTVHLKDAAALKSYEQSLSKLGVKGKSHAHDNHFDLTLHVPQWQKVEFTSHAETEKWEKWLGSLGFETKHSH